MTKVLLTGANGQLGRAISILKPNNVNLISLTRKELDLCNLKQIKSIIKQVKPDWVINCAAYTQVDYAEKEYELAKLINAEAPRILSESLRDYGGQLIHISTDFVFNGKSNIPYKTKDKKDPINMYGKSKSLGEDYIEKILEPTGQSILLRTSWVISPFGKNFLLTMLNLHRTKNLIKVVADQIGCPTSTFSLGRICWDLMFKKMDTSNFPKKLHYSDSGVASWYDLAVAIGEIGEELSLLKNKSFVKPIKTKDYPLPALRPNFSLLDSEETHLILDLKQIHWRETVREILSKIKL